MKTRGEKGLTNSVTGMQYCRTDTSLTREREKINISRIGTVTRYGWFSSVLGKMNYSSFVSKIVSGDLRSIKFQKLCFPFVLPLINTFSDGVSERRVRVQ